MNYLFIGIILLQFVLLAMAVRWRVQRVEKRYPRSSITPQNGKSNKHQFTPAQGTHYLEQ